MKDRIQIDGHWYVLEKNTNTQLPIKSLNFQDCTHTNNVIYEENGYFFEASKIQKNQVGDYYDDISITFIDKRGLKSSPSTTHYFDSMSYFKGVIENNRDSYLSSLELMDDECYSDFRSFLIYLQDINFVKFEK